MRYQNRRPSTLAGIHSVFSLIFRVAVAAAADRKRPDSQSDRRPRPRFFEPRPKMEVDYCRDRQNGHRGKSGGI